ncbi:MAG: hypothetical protein ACJAWO_000956 [Halieaceae bacterium]|jgi:hypothetical protein
MVTLFFSIGLTTFGQQDTTWTKTYGGDRDDHGYDIISTEDSGYLIIGSTSSFGFDNSQMYFLKLDSLGDIMWSKSHGGTGQEAGYSVIQTRDGGFLGVGYTNSWGAGGFDLLLVKLSANGSLEYEKYFGGTDWDFAWDVIETDSNMFVIAGETQSFGNGGKDAWLVRYDANYEIFDWNKTYGGIHDEYYKAITKDLNNDLFASGGGINPNRTDEDVLISKFDPLGDTVWNKYYGDTLQDYANDITFFSDSSIVFTGRVTEKDTIKTYVVKMDENGTLIWQDRLVNSKKATGVSVCERPDGNPAILSQIESTSIGIEFWYVFMGYNGSGTMGSLQDDWPSKMILAKNGKYILAGSTMGFNTNYTKVLVYQTTEGYYNTDNYYYVKDLNNVLSLDQIENKPEIKITKNENIYFFQFESNFNIGTIEVFNIQGQLCKRQTTQQKSIEIDLTHFPSGIYFYRIVLDNTIFSNSIFLD